MSLDEFKNIFWFEYLHRMMGRFIGEFWVIPGIYFIARGHVSPSIRNRILLVSAMIGSQVILDSFSYSVLSGA
jgi:cytochrome c oxidase assembly protein subunit 15